MNIKYSMRQNNRLLFEFFRLYVRRMMEMETCGWFQIKIHFYKLLYRTRVFIIMLTALLAQRHLLHRCHILVFPRFFQITRSTRLVLHADKTQMCGSGFTGLFLPQFFTD